MKTRYIGGILNTDPTKIKEILAKENFKFRLIIDYNESKIPSIEIQKSKKLIFGFTSSQGLINGLEKQLYHPPILFESAPVIKHINLNQKVIFLDAKILSNGLVLFQQINLENLVKLINSEFIYDSDIKFEKSKTVQFGNNSKLSLLLNRFLVTLPTIVHEPTLVAFTTSLEKFKFKILERYIINNRLVTDENKKEFEALIHYLTEVKGSIKKLVQENKIVTKDKEIKASLSRVRFLIKYFGTKKVDEYLDKENNVVVNQ